MLIKSPSSSLLLFFSLIAWPVASSAEFFIDAGGEVTSNDNVSRAWHDIDSREDMFFALNANGGYFYQPGAYTSFSLLGNFEARKYDSYDGMDNVNLGIGAAIGHKFGVGDDVPSLDFTLGADRNTFEDDIRDSWIYSASITLSQRLGDRLFAGIGARFETRDGDHDLLAVDDGPGPGPGPGPAPGPGPGPGPAPQPKPGDAFSTDSAALLVFADLDLTELTWLSAGYLFADGEVTSTSIPRERIINAANAITNDRVFGQGMYAYRIDASTHRFNLDWNMAFRETGTFLIGVEHQDVNGEAGIDYSVNLIRAALLFAF